KGSTAAMLHRVLTLAGYRTALYTSPHITSFTERIRVRDREIFEEEVVELADEIEQRTSAADIRLTFFELITVMAFIHFARRSVDVAVVEVGLGGRLDATNFVTSCVSIITTIAKDHEAYLGSELLSIAREKGGIIKPGVPLVGGAFCAGDSALIRRHCARPAGRELFFRPRFLCIPESRRALRLLRPARRVERLFSRAHGPSSKIERCARAMRSGGRPRGV